VNQSSRAIANVRAVASRYKGVQVATASPVQIVAMLHDGILRFVSEAQAALETDDRARVGDRLEHAQAIFDELAATLDPKHAPELADNLLGLYFFCKRRLTTANLERTHAPLEDVVRVVTPLRDAWATLAAASHQSDPAR
jgi:flagellar protein FliS